MPTHLCKLHEVTTKVTQIPHTKHYHWLLACLSLTAMGITLSLMTDETSFPLIQKCHCDGLGQEVTTDPYPSQTSHLSSVIPKLPSYNTIIQRDISSYKCN